MSSPTPSSLTTTTTTTTTSQEYHTSITTTETITRPLARPCLPPQMSVVILEEPSILLRTIIIISIIIIIIIIIISRLTHFSVNLCVNGPVPFHPLWGDLWRLKVSMNQMTGTITIGRLMLGFPSIHGELTVLPTLAHLVNLTVFFLSTNPFLSGTIPLVLCSNHFGTMSRMERICDSPTTPRHYKYVYVVTQ